MSSSNRLISIVVQSPELTAKFSHEDWDTLIRQARRANILGILYYFLCEKKIKQGVPEFAFRHFRAQANLDKNYRDAVGLECQRIGDILFSINVPLVVLKGAAYVVADLPVSYGRMFSDIDILVPKSRIEEVEQIFKLHGWLAGKIDAYDDKYYRQWMHEIPPLVHIKRGTPMDVHHAILPATAKLKPDSGVLLQSAVPVSDSGRICVLAPEDMVLHSMTHLFHEGEFDHGMRDLIDLDGLLKYYAERDVNFWSQLLARAKVLDLSLPLFYGLRYLHLLLKSPVPENVMLESAQVVGGQNKIMDVLFCSALLPDHKSCDNWFTPIARWCLYVRSHHLRMPAYLLVPHLLRKAHMKRKEKNESAVAEKNNV